MCHKFAHGVRGIGSLDVDEVMGNAVLLMGQYFPSPNIHALVDLKRIAANNVRVDARMRMMLMGQFNGSGAFPNTGWPDNHSISAQGEIRA